MRLQDLQNRIIELFSIFVAQIKGHTAIGNTDINRIAETVLIPVFKEVYGYQDLKNLNSEGNKNNPAIDLGDETAKIAIQVTATPDSDKIKDTLRGFIKHEFHQIYERVQIYILTEKQKSYSGKGFQEITQDKVQFDTAQDVLDYRDLLKQISTFQVEQLQRVRDILEANFGEPTQLNSPAGIPSNLPRSGVVKFVGRNQKLQDLHAQLQQNDRIAITAIAGMGGIGKTELALQYAEQYSQYYPAGICWLFARGSNLGTQLIGYFQGTLGLQIPDWLKTLEQQVMFCWRHWPSGNTLMIVDDVINYSRDIQPYLPSKDQRFRILMTTRQEFMAPIQAFSLEVLTAEASLDLLKSMLDNQRIEEEKGFAVSLCEWLGYLPLGLELVGRFLAKGVNQSLSISTMLGRLREKALSHRALVRRADEPAWTLTAQRGVEAAFELSWDQLGLHSQRLGKLLSLFALAPIPWDLVERSVQKQIEIFPNNIILNFKDLDEAREALVSLHLLQKKDLETYQLHSLIREFFREKLDGRNTEEAA